MFRKNPLNFIFLCKTHTFHKNKNKDKTKFVLSQPPNDGEQKQLKP